MNIEKHISELLFEHDCVIVPGFGGFVCNYSPAYIHEGKNQFHPPFKKISFNRNLKNNDGLLANQISQEEKISYSEANDFISAYVETLNKELNSGKRFDVKNIGTFYSGAENTISFEQDETINYLQESFGLTTFYSPTIKREPIERKIQKTLQDKKIIPSKEKTETHTTARKIPVMRYVAIAASLIIICSFVFVSLKTDLLKNVSIANLNPFSEKGIALYNPNNSDALPDAAKDNVRDLLASNRNDTMHYLNIMINGTTPIVVSLEENKSVEKKSIKQIHKKSSGHFQIIGGAFAIPENAEKFVTKLKKLGYDAVIIDKKLHMVSYGSFATREEALQALEKIRAVQQDAWLMRN